ncbi:DUF3048 domain-containing protein [Streptomyces sp. GC420]|uniref:DUF3048 domain-containing protein n=1 Tax=Streptomyces sp. GC420 TaxID=2697568 RepID=UPI0014151217|nr:DUF3048 domain-containing protein [Streptomyces sp. GC420]NBM15729.1 DUF3048 domain-containing protein [Streptomyces sp. GC420]
MGEISYNGATRDSNYRPHIARVPAPRAGEKHGVDGERATGPTRRLVLTTLTATALGTFAAGCDTQDKPSQDKPGEVRSPFTGRAATPGPVLAVKIDNVAAARPQTGLDAADIVYVEEVEAGLTRLLAVYSSRLPDVVGPVRSARESDLELLRQFGRPALAFSGAQSALLPLIDAAPLYPLPPDKAPAAYFRGQDRAAPHNLLLRPERALKAAPDASEAGDIGFRFGAAPVGGTATSGHTVRFPAARYAFTWSADRDRWLIAMDGTAARTSGGDRLGAATVVVQYVTVRSSRFHDRWGSVSPYSETVGSGDALVLRDGRAHEARWSRTSAQSGTRYTTPGGEELAFARGPVWVVLAPR